MTSLDTDRPSESVTVVRLMEPPAVDEWEAVLDSLNRHAARCDLLVLRGPGWFADAYARSMTAVTVQSMRIQGREVAIDEDDGHRA